MAAKMGKNRVIQDGAYRRIEWPFFGGVMKQPNIIVEAFKVISAEYERMLFAKVK